MKKTVDKAVAAEFDNKKEKGGAVTEEKVTSFQDIYDFFLSGITDDMYMELTEEDTKQILEELLTSAITSFEFPRWKNPFILDLDNKTFTVKLTLTEMKIIALYMTTEWLGYQLANVDLVRQKYSGSDFRLSSQASHMKQLISLKQEYELKALKMQRLYSRREIDEDGRVQSAMYKIMNYDSPSIRNERG